MCQNESILVLFLTGGHFAVISLMPQDICYVSLSCLSSVSARCHSRSADAKYLTITLYSIRLGLGLNNAFPLETENMITFNSK